MAIRVYLESFRLPGEAQKINRIMESFGKAYHGRCPALFRNADAVYILAYSVILLNTDQHNSQARPAPPCTRALGRPRPPARRPCRSALAAAALPRSLSLSLQGPEMEESAEWQSQLVADHDFDDISQSA